MWAPPFIKPQNPTRIGRLLLFRRACGIREVAKQHPGYEIQRPHNPEPMSFAGTPMTTPTSDPYLTAAEFARYANLEERRCQRWARTEGLVKDVRKVKRPGLMGEVWEAPLSSWQAVSANPPRRGPKPKRRSEPARPRAVQGTPRGATSSARQNLLHENEQAPPFRSGVREGSTHRAVQER